MSESSETGVNKIKCNDYHNPEELINYYDQWANDYDEDTKNKRGYVCHEVGAKKLVQFLKQYHFGTNCRILDVGSGTGLVGEELRRLNYTNVDALEPSEKSNDVAKSKDLYKKYYVELLGPGKQLSILSNTYDSAICIGVFTKGNVKAEGAMDEMVRVVRPHGLICFSIREDIMFDKEYGYEEKMAKLCEDNSWKLLCKSIEPYHVAGDLLNCHMFVYQVL